MPGPVPTLRPVVGLIGAHLLLSLAAIAVLIADAANLSVATQDAWVHGVIVAATAILLLTFAVRALSGKRSAYVRLRISSAILLVALIIIAVLPGAFPVWMRVMEAVSAVCLAVAVVIINTGDTRAAFANTRS